jgi:subtilase family serine protease
MPIRLQLIATVLIALALAGCGGGSGEVPRGPTHIPKGIDLILTTIQVPSEPVHVNETVFVNVFIKNAASEGAANFFVQLVVNQGTITTEYLRPIVFLGGGGSAVAAFTILLNSDFHDGTAPLRLEATVDPANSVGEVLENNNAATKLVMVVPVSAG